MTVSGMPNFEKMLLKCKIKWEIACERINVEKLGDKINSDHFGFLLLLKKSVSILVHSISGISWSIIGSAGC